MQTIDFSSLTAEDEQLIHKANKALQYAYNPYSSFAVGAALYTKSQKIYTGANVENAAHGASLCAERVALTKAYSEGDQQIEQLAVIGRGKQQREDEVTPPCGICRQVFFEATQVNNQDIKVFLPSYDHSTLIATSIQELLPLGFS